VILPVSNAGAADIQGQRATACTMMFDAVQSAVEPCECLVATARGSEVAGQFEVHGRTESAVALPAVPIRLMARLVVSPGAGVDECADGGGAGVARAVGDGGRARQIARGDCRRSRRRVLETLTVPWLIEVLPV
jgi:hypothetical protein